MKFFLSLAAAAAAATGNDEQSTKRAGVHCEICVAQQWRLSPASLPSSHSPPPRTIGQSRRASEAVEHCPPPRMYACTNTLSCTSILLPCDIHTARPCQFHVHNGRPASPTTTSHASQPSNSSPSPHRRRRSSRAPVSHSLFIHLSIVTCLALSKETNNGYLCSNATHANANAFSQTSQPNRK